MAHPKEGEDDLSAHTNLATPQAKTNDTSLGSIALTREAVREHSLELLAQHAVRRRAVRDVESGTPETVRVTLQNVSYTRKAMNLNPKNNNGVFPRSQSTAALAGSKNDPFILKDLNVVFPPGSMTLVLGPPQCGKSSLLKLLAGIIPHDNHVGRQTKTRVHGNICYNGQTAEDINIARVSSYVPQTDKHIPTLTTKETIAFAQSCVQRPLQKKTLDEENAVVEGIEELVGLSECSNTIVGDDLLRGISGGQKRRVTLAEMGVFGDPRLVVLDEFTTGLDAKVAIELTTHLRTLTNELQWTVVSALLQPPPEVLTQFDQLLLLDHGRVVYAGPMDRFLPYMHDIGYDCPPRQDVADFCQEVTTEVGAAYRRQDLTPTTAVSHLADESAEVATRGSLQAVSSNGELARGIQATEEFERAYVRSDTHRMIVSQLASFDSIQVDRPLLADGTPIADNRHPTNRAKRLPWHAGLCAVFGRQFKIETRNVAFAKVRVFQSLMMGFIVGSTFYQLPSTGLSSVSIKLGLVFLTLLFTSLTTMANIQYTQALREILYKQTNGATQWYNVGHYAVAESLMECFWSVFQVALFATPCYFLSGLTLADDGEHFWVFLGVTIVSTMAYAQLFKMIAAATPNDVLAQTCAGFIVFLMNILSGFAISIDNLPVGWHWFYWINPTSWSFRALVINEFSASTTNYNLIDPNTGLRMGDLYLKSYGFSADRDYVGSGVLFLLATYVVFLLGTIFAYAYIRFDLAAPSSKATSSRPTSTVTTTTPCKDGSRVGEVSLQALEAGNPELKHVDFTPVTISFRDLGYTVQLPPTKKKVDIMKKTDEINEKRLLSNIHGCFLPGRLTALMGASGAGKTTLMDVLASRKTAGRIDGQIFANGNNILASKEHMAYFNRHIGYCEQTDLHSQTATVQEALIFSAMLRLPRRDQDDAERLSQVDSIVSETLITLKLTPLANALVKYLTQEQRKRLTIGVELVSNPSVLFLDEPTSGLDSCAAKLVMEAVQRVGESGRTVVCTIHQPNAMLFGMFDDLLLLQPGGQMVYCGPIGKNACDLLDYFDQAIDSLEAQNSISLPRIESWENPATYMLNCLSALPEASIYTFTDVYKGSLLRGENLSAIDNAITHQVPALDEASEEVVNNASSSSYNSSMAEQWVATCRRTAQKIWRSREYTWSRVIVGVLVALVFGSIYFSRRTLETTLDVYSRMNLIFFALAYIGVIQVMMCTPFIAGERATFYRERSSRMYSVESYLGSHVLAEIPYLLLNTVVFANLFYWLCGLQATWNAYGWFFLMLLLYITYNTFFGQLLAFAMPDLQSAMVVNGVVMAMQLNFGGYLVSVGDMPRAWRFMYWLNPFHYSMEAMVTSQFLNDHTAIAVGDDPTSAQMTTVASFTHEYFKGKWALSHQGYDVAAMVVWIALTILGSYLGLKYVNHMKR